MPQPFRFENPRHPIIKGQDKTAGMVDGVKEWWYGTDDIAKTNADYNPLTSYAPEQVNKLRPMAKKQKRLFDRGAPRGSDYMYNQIEQYDQMPKNKDKTLWNLRKELLGQ